MKIASCLVTVVVGLPIAPLAAQDHSAHSGHAPPASAPAEAMPAEQHAHEHPGHAMPGLLGPSMSREASGTSWQPQSTPMPSPMIHVAHDEWMLMVHGWATLIYDYAGGDRGDEDVFSSNMLMLMARRELGPGVLGLRGMFSLEPATIGSNGYPLLLQTGETADGEEHLIDRQHPHDFFMELAGSYTLPMRGGADQMFVYLGLPGEPALGPPTFMHRFSGVDNPEAPITHHYLDSTHITFGVATVGYVINDVVKVEGSVFTGREPDQHRWNIEDPEMDSQSVRVTVNPSDDWSFQASYGWLNSPEQLAPDLDQQRVTASATYNRPLGGRSNFQAMAAWGRNNNDPGNTLDAFLVEAAVNFRQTHTVFGRFENVEKDELFDEDEPLAGSVFRVNKLSLGYIYDFPVSHGLQLGVGALGSVHFLPSALDDVYGDTPMSAMIFARVRW